MRIVMLLIMFLLLGAFFIVSNENIRLNVTEDRSKFGDFYYSWIGGLYEKATGITGFVINSEWLDYRNSTKNEIIVRK